MSPDPFDRFAFSRKLGLVDPDFRRKSTLVASERVRNAARESDSMRLKLTMVKQFESTAVITVSESLLRTAK
jgi:hypothetical protein